MTLALSVSALAASGTNNDNGKITINNAVVGQTYTIYQILKLESYNTDSGAYSYKATDAWKSFVEGATVKNIYMSTDTQGYVTWVKDADVVAFAKLAQAYAAEHKIANQGNKVAAAAGDEKTTTVEFTDLNLGYYLLDSSMGTLCSLNTTHTEVVIQEKNAEPTNEKKVEEDATKDYGKVNDADIGQTVNFQSTITAQAGAENYVFHDKMSSGLTFGSVTGITLNGETVNADNYTIKTSGFATGHDCTFEVIFTRDFCNTLKANNKIVISYTATVNDKAVIGGNGNLNESKIEYGESGKTTTTPPSTTTTYTWKIDVFKYTVVKATEEGKEDTEKGLAGAEFILYKDVTNNDNTTTHYYATAATIDGGYRFTGWTTDKNAATKFVTPDNGKFAIKGLDSDTYYLEEIVAPAGYNTLKEPVTITISPDGKVNVTTENPNGVDTVKVLNQSGTELPSTGGMGTTIFYVLGGVLMAGAFVLLVVRKRMRTE